VSPTEVEEALYATGNVLEAAAFGIEDAALGQAIAVVVVPAASRSVDAASLIAECRRRLPFYMVPGVVHIAAQSLPRNANGKIDRRALAESYVARTAGRPPAAPDV
jgi:acyl-CoA synthetase (AMP-forming)/AMP-acid ligase II